MYDLIPFGVYEGILLYRIAYLFAVFTGAARLHGQQCDQHEAGTDTVSPQLCFI